MRDLFKISRKDSVTKQTAENLRSQSISASLRPSSTNISPPPSYTEQDPAVLPEVVVDLEAAFSNLTFSATASRTPDPNDCIAHLKLLECFHTLREEIRNQPGIFGIDDSGIREWFSKAQASLGASINDEEQAKYAKAVASMKVALENLKDKRWAIYVARAADRYAKWFQTLPTSTATRAPNMQQDALRVEDIETDAVLTGMMKDVTPHTWTSAALPPLDILMVWHSHRLNPRIYLEDCLRHCRMNIWSSNFPWAVISPHINNTTFEYMPSQVTKDNFKKEKKMAWQNVYDPTTVKRACANCKWKFVCPWTTQVPSDWSDFLSSQKMPSDYGLSSNDFQYTCMKCRQVNTQESMQWAKFYNDTKALWAGDIALPGTVLSLDGRVLTWTKSTLLLDPRTFPNRLIKAVIPQVDVFTTANGSQNMECVRTLVENAIKDREIVKSTVSNSKKERLDRTERVATRRMLSRYQDNSSFFGIDLVGAVIRQGTFIGKMHAIDWLHSPALRGTVDRLLMKYDRFIRVMQKFPQKIIVPTLDIDLAWHTHQLACKSYYDYTTLVLHRFVDHDDKIAEGRLSNAFAFTCKVYKKMFKEPYSECNCWYCAAVREGIRGSAFSQPPPDVVGATYSSQRGPHISAHGSVQGDYMDQTETIRTTQTVQAWSLAAQDRRRKKALSRSQRLTQDQAEGAPKPYAYNGGGLDLAAYPYGASGYDPSMYSGNPGCMDSGLAGPGGCAAGTCGSAVAAGSCASAAGGCGGAGYSGESGAADGTSAGGCSSGGGDGGDGGGGGCGGGCGGCGGCG